MIRLASDLHLEFLEDALIVNDKMTSDEYDLAVKMYTHTIFPPSLSDSETILILAGDILLLKHLHKYMAFWKQLSLQFKHVLWVFGNHEWFKYKLKFENVQKAKAQLSKYANIHILYNEHIELEGSHFIGSTLWSNLGDGSIFTTKTIAETSFDYKIISIKDKGLYSKLRPRHVIQMNLDQRSFILKKLLDLKSDDKPKYVITHHPPSVDSVPDHYKNDPSYWSDFSIFDFEALKAEDAFPDFWFHGHIHETQKYHYVSPSGKELWIMSNPRGYPLKNDLNEEYDPNFLIKD